MSEKEKKVNTLFTLIDKVLYFGIGYLVSIILARYMGPENNGIYNYAIAFNSLFFAIASLGLERIVMSELSKGVESTKVVGTGIVLQICGSIVALFFSYIVLQILSENSLTKKMCLIIAIVYFFQALSSVQYWFYAQFLSKELMRIGVANRVVFLVVRIIAVYMGIGLIGLIVIYVVEFAAQYLAYLCRYVSKNGWAFGFSAIIARNMLHKSWPLILGTICTTIYMRIDQLMIEKMLGNYQLGIYSVGVKISEMGSFIPSAISATMIPDVTRETDGKKRKYKYQSYFDLVTGISYVIAIVVTLVAKPFILFLYGREYAGATIVLCICIWANVFINIAVIRGNYFAISGKTIYSLIVTSLGAIINVGLNLVFIPKLGIAGASLATLISYVFYAYITSYLFKELKFLGKMQTNSLFKIWRYKKWVKKLKISRK